MEAYSLRLSFVQYGCLTHHTLNRFVELFNVVNLFVSFLTRTECQKKKKKKPELKIVAAPSWSQMTFHLETKV